MAEPLSLIALGAAVGGIAGKVVEKAWDSGEKWLDNYLKDHGPRARATARENVQSFLKLLIVQINRGQGTSLVDETQIIGTLDHPDFSSTLQQAMLAAATTDSTAKHDVLAALIASRLRVAAETRLAVATKLCCHAVSHSTPTQLHCLGLYASVFIIKPTNLLGTPELLSWLQTKFEPYQQLEVSRFDLLHLETLACLKPNSHEDNSLKGALSRKVRYQPDLSDFISSSLGRSITRLWEAQRLALFTLTTTGVITGVHVSDLLTGGITELKVWD